MALKKRKVIFIVKEVSSRIMYLLNGYLFLELTKKPLPSIIRCWTLKKLYESD